MSDKKLENLLKTYKKEIKNLVQVGAHFGQELEIIEEHINGNIFLFEPNESAIKVLKAKVGMNSNIKIFPYALGSENTLNEMFYSNENDGQSSSLLKPDLHINVQPQIEFKEKIKVSVKRFEDLNIDNADFLIMDVQGFELEVLKGFGKKLKDVQFIYTEVNRDYLYENNVLIGELDAFLKSKNFLRVWTIWRRADMPWGDAFYIKVERIGKYKSKLLQIKNKLFTNKVIFFFYYIFDPRLIKKRVKKIIGRT